jgi:hypothetical protein
LVVDPPAQKVEMAVPSKRKKAAEKPQGGIEEWFINAQHEDVGIDDS